MGGVQKKCIDWTVFEKLDRKDTYEVGLTGFVFETGHQLMNFGWKVTYATCTPNVVIPTNICRSQF